MWLNGDYLVPYLNGVAYSHKPPLLFWLINLGWKVFGVNDWWPRLIPSLFALASVFVTRKIAGRLWPELISIKDNASLILIGSGLWVLYSTALMFDMMIAFFTALGIWGLLIAYQSGDKKGWLMLALAIGGGLLAKGPTILLQLLPVALLTKWWDIDNHSSNKINAHKIDAKHWYLPLFYSVIGGAVIALIWAIPAGIHGGKVYQHAIFWGQTADRMVDSFAHNRPFWWYLPILPLLMFPWLFWGRFWQGLKNYNTKNMGIRFCIAWALPVFISFSFISGKQIHYILPLFPAFALLIARLSHAENNSANSLLESKNTRLNELPILLVTIFLGLVFLVLPSYARSHSNFTTWVQHIPLWLGGLTIALAILIYFLPKKTVSNTISQLGILSIFLVTVYMYVIVHTAGDAYDLRPISTNLKQLESQNIPLAHSGKYPGIYNFLGRLKQSPEVIPEHLIASWFTAHPNGRLIEYYRRDTPIQPQQVEYMQAYKGISVAILTQAQWQAISNQAIGNKAPSTEAD